MSIDDISPETKKELEELAMGMATVIATRALAIANLIQKQSELYLAMTGKTAEAINVEALSKLTRVRQNDHFARTNAVVR